MLRRAVGVLLLALTIAPVYRVLGGRTIGLSGRDTAAAAERAYELLFLGSAIVLTIAVLLSRIVSHDRLNHTLRAIARLISFPGPVAFAAGAGAAAGALTLLFSLGVLDGKPNLVDGMVQLLHSRFMSEGALSANVDFTMPFWHVQNSVVTPAGWVSHFPPGFTVFLAAGHLIRAPWLIGAVLAAAAIFFTALATERLLPEKKPAVRMGILLAAQSPFFVGLAGAYMNHVGAAAFIGLGMYAAVRGSDGGARPWMVVCGAALGAAFTIRPLAAIVAALPVIVLSISRSPAARWASTLRDATMALAGAAPFGLATAWYNDRFFGSPFRFGYEYAFGSAVGLGFRRDPWGNVYGPWEALGFTSADLVTLSLNLLESPLPTVAVIGVYLATAARLSLGEWFVALWALLPVAANSLYWHHGNFMGPRMLNDVAPAWCVLFALSAAGIVRSISPGVNVRGYFARVAVAAALMIAVAAGTLYLGPERLLGYRTYMRSSRIMPPALPDSSLVFVHGAWTSRVAMRLAAAGMQLDSVETALRQNATCKVDAYAKAYAAARELVQAETRRSMDFEPRVERALPNTWVRAGYVIRVTADDPITPACLRELEADRFGIVDVSPMLWQARVPGLNGTGALLVRDMGPEENTELIRRYRGYKAVVFHRPSPDAAPVISPYDEAMAVLWR